MSIDPSLSHTYLIGNKPVLNSFQEAMDHCASMGANSVHVNSQGEHDAIINYIKTSGKWLHAKGALMIEGCHFKITINDPGG